MDSFVIIIILLVIIFVVIKLIENKKQKIKPTSQEPKAQEPKVQEPTPQEPKKEKPTPQEPKVQEQKKEEPSPQKPKVQEQKKEEPSPQEPKVQEQKKEEPKAQEQKKEPKSQEQKKEEPRVQEPNVQEPKVQEPKVQEPTFNPSNIIRKFNSSSFGYGSNPKDNIGNILSDKMEQYIYEKQLQLLQKQLMPIGSIIFSSIPLQKDQINVFTINGYVLQPLTNIQNPVTQKYFNGKNVQTPKIVNLKIRGSEQQTISHNDIQYSIFPNSCKITNIPHQHQIELDNVEQIHTRAQHRVAAWWPGGKKQMIYTKTKQTSSKTNEDSDSQVIIDVRDKSNVFFFYMIIGYEDNEIILRDPDDPDLTNPLDYKYWQI